MSFTMISSNKTNRKRNGHGKILRMGLGEVNSGVKTSFQDFKI